MAITINGTTGIAGVDGSASTPAVQGTDTNTGIFFPAADTIAFGEGGAEVARFNSSGQLGIGTTAPGNILELKAATPQQIFNQTTGNSNQGIVFQSNGTTYGRIFNNAASGVLDIRNGLNSGDGYLVTFSTDGSERARITSTGSFLVGTTSKLNGGIPGIDINGSAESGITLGWGGTSEAFFYLSSATVSRWETASGTTIAVSSGNNAGVSLANGGTSWGSLSDERKKDIIEPIENAAEKVSSLRAVIGKYKTDDEGTRRSLLIAQDVQAVLPEAVVENEDGNLILQYTETIPLLVAAIQELKAELDTTKARLAALEAK